VLIAAVPVLEWVEPVGVPDSVNAAGNPEDRRDVELVKGGSEVGRVKSVSIVTGFMDATG